MNRLALGIGIGVTASAVVVGVFAAGRASTDQQHEPRSAASSTTTSTTERWPTARRHAYAACVAIHRPNQISFDNRRAVTDEEIRSADVDAISEAEEAAADDPKWRPLATAIAEKQRNAHPDPNDLEGSFTRYNQAFAALRAQCLLTGAGDINTANLVAHDPPPN